MQLKCCLFVFFAFLAKFKKWLIGKTVYMDMREQHWPFLYGRQELIFMK